MATLELENVVKDYPGGVRAVDDLTLEVADGELMVLVGPSGCGKTTILRMIAGLEPVTRGEIHISGRPAAGLRPKDRDVAMVFQNSALYPHLSVAGNMAFGLKLRRLAQAEIRRRVRRAADVLGIAELLARRPGELSGGQRQRAALARAIVRRPGLFLFDEPLSNLDAPLRSQLRRQIRRLHQRLGVTTVYVTHDQTEAMTLGQRIAVMHKGRLQQLAEPPTLYRRPANRLVAALIGSPAMNFFPGHIQRRGEALVFRAAGSDSRDDRDGFTLPVPTGWTSRLEPYLQRPITLGIRPEHLGPAAAGASPDPPRIPGKVEALEPIGPEVHVHLNTGRHTFVSRMGTGRTFHIGEQIELAVATANLHFFDSETGDSVG